MPASPRTGRRLLPVFQYRFAPGTERLERLIEQGLTGQLQVLAAETHWNRKAAYYALPWRGTWAGERGGCLLGHAIHTHDLLTWLVGPVVRLNAMTATRVNPIETEDCAALGMMFEGGALGTSSVTLGSADEISRLRFCFEHLTAENDGREPYAPGRGPWRFVARDPGRQAEIDAALALPVAEREGYVRLLELFHEHLEGAGPSPVGVERRPRLARAGDGRLPRRPIRRDRDAAAAGHPSAVQLLAAGHRAGPAMRAPPDASGSWVRPVGARHSGAWREAGPSLVSTEAAPWPRC